MDLNFQLLGAEVRYYDLLDSPIDLSLNVQPVATNIELVRLSLSGLDQWTTLSQNQLFIVLYAIQN
jgi:hypothetical protein